MNVKVLDKEFEPSISEAEILASIKKAAAKMNDELRDKNPLILCVLNGAFMFAADLVRELDFPCEISFVKVASYSGTSSTGTMKHLIGVNESVADRTVVIVEDIVDTGYTMVELKKQVEALGAKEVKIATLLFKPANCKVDLKLDYVAMEIGNDFIVGYGLDYDGFGRNLRSIYKIVNK